MRRGALLIGFPRLEIGLGEHIRTSAQCFLKNEINFAIYDLSHIAPGRKKDHRYDQFITKKTNYKAHLFHMNSGEMYAVTNDLDQGFLNRSYNIIYPFWELSEFPSAFVPAINLMDEVWVASRFIQESILPKANCPVLLMPMSVDFNVPRWTRKQFGLPTECYLFIFCFDFQSYIARKNPQAVLKAFKLAFKTNSRNTKLVFKTNNMSSCPNEFIAFKELISHDPDIILIDRIMNYEQLIGLLDCCDCFVSLHRSEGFGRGIAESMFLGKPVIVTNYSGNMDFTNNENACLVDYTLVKVNPGEYIFGENQVWAEPDIECAAWHMKRLVDELYIGKQLGLAAKNFIQENYNCKQVGQNYKKRLKQLKILN